MIRSLGMRHLALKVRDVERSAQFYERAFGMRRFAAKSGGNVIPLVSPGLKDQITLSSADTSEVGGASGRIGEHGGIDHFGFLVPPGTRLDRVIDELTSLGATFVQRVDVARGVPSAFFRDPDGYPFQIIRFPRFTSAYVALLPFLSGLGRRKT